MKDIFNKVLEFMGGVIPLSITAGGVFLLFLIAGIVCAATKTPAQPTEPTEVQSTVQTTVATESAT